MSDDTERLEAKLQQARQVIAHLLGEGAARGSEGERALRYFSTDRYDPAFLPWPRREEGIRPEDLSAANDD